MNIIRSASKLLLHRQRHSPRRHEREPAHKLLTVVSSSQRVPMTYEVRDGGAGVRPSATSIWTARETKPAWPLLLW